MTKTIKTMENSLSPELLTSPSEKKDWDKVVGIHFIMPVIKAKVRPFVFNPEKCRNFTSCFYQQLYRVVQLLFHCFAKEKQKAFKIKATCSKCCCLGCNSKKKKERFTELLISKLCTGSLCPLLVFQVLHSLSLPVGSLRCDQKLPFWVFFFSVSLTSTN